MNNSNNNLSKTTTSHEDDWENPLTTQDLQAIDAAFHQATTSTTTTTTPLHSLSNNTKRAPPSPHTPDDNPRPSTRRKLPSSLSHPGPTNFHPGSGSSSGPGPLRPCHSAPPRQGAGKLKMDYPVLNFAGHIVYARTFNEVEKASLQLLKFLNMMKKRQNGWAVVGLDIEWKPTFRKGVPPGKAAVMQICGDMNNCFVFHIIHSGIPPCLRFLLEDLTTIKVGVGIDNDAMKVFQDHNVPTNSWLDLSCLANEKLVGARRQWGLSSLLETVICKQILKPKLIRLGNWEAKPLSEPQLKYAATDAFASWYLYEVLKTFPDLHAKQNGK